ncbi:hypothetical protein VTL71DRAFT_13789 [Oculimacula yallundae]|uniref:Uncharacterized protein n=1 Tax=Oculimacula yallundae TaxID=86028 RepID=A0ABR4CNA4_9HELO
MAPLMLTSEPHYAFDQYGAANNVTADQSDDEIPHPRERPRRTRGPPPPPPFRRTRRESWSSDSGSLRGRRARSNPRSTDGKRALTCELNLGSKTASIDNLRWKPRTSTWPNLSPRTSSRKLERINILASTTYVDDQGEATVEIQSDLDNGSDAHFIHWLHVQRDNMDLDEFENLALQSPRISDEMALVVGHLMTKVRKELEKSFVHGRYMAPDVLRCDGLDTGNSEKEDISALWISLPYFSMESPKVSRVNTSTSTFHPLRTLLQSCYDFESTHDRESTHLLHGLTQSGQGDKVVSVPQVWCLILGTDTIITSSQTDLDILSEPAISRTIFTGASDKASLVKIIDPYKRQFFLPIKSCRTFYEMKELVVEQCLSDISLSIEYYDLVHNGTVLASHNWKDTVRTTKGLIIVVSLVETKTEGSSDPRTAVAFRHDPSSQDPVKKRTSQETSDSSESSSDEDYEIAQAQAKMNAAEARANNVSSKNELMIFPTHRPFAPLSPSRIRSKERLRNFERLQELTRSGLIINEPDSVPAKKTVKMYSLKTEPKKTVPEHPQSSRHVNPKVPLEQFSRQPFVTEPKFKSSTERTGPPRNGKNKTVPLLKNDTETPKVALRAPPFFIWNVEEPSGKPGKANSIDDISNPKGLKHILSRTESKILQPDFALAKSWETFLELRTSFDRSTVYKETPSADIDELELMKKPMANKLKNLRQRLTQLTPRSQTDENRQTSSKSAFVLNPQSENDDPFVLKLQIALHSELEALIILVEDLVAYFVPRSYDHSLLKKIWGALGTLITIVSEDSSSGVSPHNTGQQKPNPSRKDVWTVRWFSEDDTAAVIVRNETKLQPSKWSRDCRECDKRDAATSYSSHADAIEHLVTKHYAIHRLTAAEKSRLSILVRSFDQHKSDNLRRYLLTIIQTFVASLKTVTAGTKEMLEAVAEANEENSDQDFNYHLPRTVVRSFQNNVVLITTASQAVRRLEYLPSSPWASASEENVGPNFNSLLSFLGLRTEISMTAAMKDLILMVRTGETSESVNYAAVGPRYIALVFYKNLLTRNLLGETGLVDFYKKRTLKLQYDVYHKPARRRILGEIQLLHEEISAALTTRIAQAHATCHIGWVGNARSYRISNQSRNQQYDLERDIGQGCVDQLYSDRDDLKRLLQRLSTLEQKVRYRVEVLEEDNSKAIFIFTVVAAVFLPLSFVTSYLGMNTIDIRDTTRSQSIFWAAAVPATFGVVALATLVAFRDAVKEWVREKRRHFKRPAAPPSKQKTSDDRIGRQELEERAKKWNQEELV